MKSSSGFSNAWKNVEQLVQPINSLTNNMSQFHWIYPFPCSIHKYHHAHSQSHVWKKNIMKTMATTKLVLPLLLLLRLASPTSAAEFCVAKPGVSEQTLQANIFYACAQPGVDCSPIQPGGSCYTSDLITWASYAMNAYFNVYRSKGATCDFSQSAQLTSTDPSSSIWLCSILLSFSFERI